MFDPQNFNLTEQPGSGSKTGTGTEFIFAKIREVGEKGDEIWKALTAAANGRDKFRGQWIDLQGCKIELAPGMLRLYISTKTKTGSANDEDPVDTETRCNLALQPEKVPLEALDDFKMRWSYDLFYAVDITAGKKGSPSVPKAVQEATNALSGRYDGIWCYAKSQPANFTKMVGDKQHTFNWVLVQRRTKGGVSGKTMFAPVVIEKRYFSRLSAAKKAFHTPGEHKSPPESFVYPKDAKYWIVHPDGITWESGFWVTNNKYFYSPEWDKEIFGPPTDGEFESSEPSSELSSELSEPSSEVSPEQSSELSFDQSSDMIPESSLLGSSRGGLYRFPETIFIQEYIWEAGWSWDDETGEEFQLPGEWILMAEYEAYYNAEGDQGNIADTPWDCCYTADTGDGYKYDFTVQLHADTGEFYTIFPYDGGWCFSLPDDGAWGGFARLVQFIY